MLMVCLQREKLWKQYGSAEKIPPSVQAAEERNFLKRFRKKLRKWRHEPKISVETAKQIPEELSPKVIRFKLKRVNELMQNALRRRDKGKVKTTKGWTRHQGVIEGYKQQIAKLEQALKRALKKGPSQSGEEFQEELRYKKKKLQGLELHIDKGSPSWVSQKKTEIEKLKEEIAEMEKEIGAEKSEEMNRRAETDEADSAEDVEEVGDSAEVEEANRPESNIPQPNSSDKFHASTGQNHIPSFKNVVPNVLGGLATAVSTSGLLEAAKRIPGLARLGAPDMTPNF